MIEIRKIHENEYNLSRSLRIRALTEAPYAFGGTLENALNKTLKEYEIDTKRWAVSDESTFFVAFKSKIAVGMAGAYFEKGDGRAYLCSMWVDPEYRKLNIGKMIVDTVTSWLKERGAILVHAWVADNNHTAVKFYKSIGFYPSNEQEILPSNNEEIETLYFLKVNG